MITLKPIRENSKYFELIEAKIKALLRDEMFLPLLEDLEDGEVIENARQGAVLKALRKGRIVYSRGVFTGRFSASISKELKELGARWSRKDSGWALSRLTPELQRAVEASLFRYQGVIKKMQKRLDEMLPEKIAEKLDVGKIFEDSVVRLDRDIQKTIKGISVSPELTVDQLKKISDDYTTNMKLYIKDWAEKEIEGLRKKVQVQSLRGERYEELIKMIQKRYDVSHSKAKFLARQETNLFLTKVKETRYKDAGVNQYKWQTVIGAPKHPVRPMHKALDGKIFSWDNPPITSPNGDRNHPGADYNCRCVAVPVVRFS